MASLPIDPKTLMEGDLFEEIGMGGASDEKKQALLETLLKGVESRVLLRIMDLLKEDDRGSWEQVLETEDDEVIDQYLENSGIDVHQLVIEESLLLKAEVIEKVKKAREV